MANKKKGRAAAKKEKDLQSDVTESPVLDTDDTDDASRTTDDEEGEVAGSPEDEKDSAAKHQGEGAISKDTNEDDNDDARSMHVNTSSVDTISPEDMPRIDGASTPSARSRLQSAQHSRQVSAVSNVAVTSKPMLDLASEMDGAGGAEDDGEDEVFEESTEHAGGLDGTEDGRTVKGEKILDTSNTQSLDESAKQTVQEEAPASAPESTQPDVEDKTLETNGTSTTPQVELSAPSPTESSDSRPPPPKKKFSSPFGWLSRSNTNISERNAKSPPPLPPRRDTVSSVNTVASVTSDNTQDEAATKKANRISLRDRFNLVRQREESGITEEDEDVADEAEDEEDADATPTDVPAEDDAKTSIATKHARQRSRSHPPTLNPDLAPGTAAGTSTGPTSDQQPVVDWDLWQKVVYEGPAAVSRTSPAELNKAIANGIPSAIRGVVWQVLASSKNEELEVVYRQLVDRGKVSERRPSDLRPGPSSMQRQESIASIASVTKDKDVDPSATPSIRSDTSRPGSPNSNGGPGPALSSVTSNDEQTGLPADQLSLVSTAQDKKKAEEEAANLRKLERAIKRDLGARTSFSKFLMSSGLQDGLFGICKAYALFDEAVGYAQGMNFIAMPLLFNMPEEEAFCLFVRLMNQYHLRDMFIQDMPGLHLHLYQFDRLLEEFEPALYCHLHRRGVSPQLYATQWFLTLFAYRFPLQLVLRIYDLILSEGLEKAILKFGIILMQKNAQKLLTMKDMAVLTTFLKERIFDVYIDSSPSAHSVLESGFFGAAGGIDREVYRADALVQDACSISITPEMLKTYTSEWEEKVRDEKEKLATEEAIRATNASLTLRLRNLEEHSEKRDGEHVQIASELVRVKVENQRLSDDNEGLNARILELQLIIQAQPGEVEEKLRVEMDRIMQRNIEVQNENRHLEEACAEMEMELVKSKMNHAETHEELDSMKTKWNNIQTVMNSRH